MLYVALAKVEVGESCFSCGVWTAMEPNSTVIFLEQTAKANWHASDSEQQQHQGTRRISSSNIFNELSE